MHVERYYRELEDVEEIRVYNINRVTLIEDAPQVAKPGNVCFSNIMKHMPSDINVFRPIDDVKIILLNESVGIYLKEQMSN